jgi:hypothetical protein
MCNRQCPGGYGVLRWLSTSAGSLAYCGTADASFDVANGATPCYALPPPAPPVKLCVLPPTYSLPTRVCPNGEARLLPSALPRPPGARPYQAQTSRPGERNTPAA